MDGFDFHPYPVPQSLPFATGYGDVRSASVSNLGRIYQAFFSYQDARQRPNTWGNLRHANAPVFQPAAAQDLALWFLEERNGLVGGLNLTTCGKAFIWASTPFDGGSKLRWPPPPPPLSFEP